MNLFDPASTSGPHATMRVILLRPPLDGLGTVEQAAGGSQRWAAGHVSNSQRRTAGCLLSVLPQTGFLEMARSAVTARHHTQALAVRGRSWRPRSRHRCCPGRGCRPLHQKHAPTFRLLGQDATSLDQHDSRPVLTRAGSIGPRARYLRVRLADGGCVQQKWRLRGVVAYSRRARTWRTC